jgi:hypothetical protein
MNNTILKMIKSGTVIANQPTFNLGLKEELHSSSFSISKILSTLLISSIGISSLNADTNIKTVLNPKTYPISQKITGTSRGGAISDIQSAKDGIGTIVIGGIAADSDAVGNKEYSKLIQRKLSELETSNNLKDIILTTDELSKINNNGFVSGISVHTPGESCDDLNAATSNDVYLADGSCKGIELVFTSTYTNLVNEATFTYKTNNSRWGQTGAGLFNKILIGSHENNTGFYWAYQHPTVVDDFQIIVQERFRIWRYSSSSYTDYNKPLQILKLDNGSWIDLSSKHLSYPNLQNTFQLFTEELEPGTYRFLSKTNKWRIDTEWFIEKKVPKTN